ncbi:Cysteine synthase [Brevibacillus laterosporus]|nr:Cysteine synthase [Brevibacillus laterosporus]
MLIYDLLSIPYVALHLVTPAELPYGSEQPPNGLRKYADQEHYLQKAWSFL